MANKIILKKSSVAAKTPLSTDLDVGELAVNLVDQKLYSKKSDGTVVLVGSGATGGSVTSVSGTGTVNGISLSGTVTSSGNLTLGGALSGVSLTTQVAGTLPVLNGGTGVTTKTGTGSVVLSNSPALVTPALGTPASGNLANCTFPTLNQNTTGNAATATTLQTARTINGVSFNGSANITVSDSTKLPLTGGTLTGSLYTRGSFGMRSSTIAGNPLMYDVQDQAGALVLELGRADNVAAVTAIDVHTGATSIDYDTRLHFSGGNGTNGNGTLNILAGVLQWNNSNVLSVNNITNYSINPRFATTIGFGNDTEVLKFNDGTNETRAGYWTNKDGFYVQGDGNNVDSVVLKTGNLDVNQNAYVVGNVGVGGTVTATAFSGSLTGNATTATTLQTARTINGVSFNGSANITVTANTPNTLSRGTYLTGANFNGSAATTWAVDATTAATASKIVARDASGDDFRRYGFAQFFNMSHSATTRSSDTTFYSSTDDYIRKNNATGFRTSLNVPTRTGGDASGTWGISISGNAATVTNGVYQNQYGSFQVSFTSNINANTNRKAGVYGSYASSATNTPTTSGLLWNATAGADGSGDGSQIWQDYASNNLYVRQRWGGSYGAWLSILSASNYNTYAPTKTGGGASGTWGINVTGNAATVSSITSGQVTGALGYTPYNSTNPNGYITSSGSITGNATTATTATNLSTGQSNWGTTGVINNVVGMLAWKNYGNAHVIFDASQGLSPSGSAVNNTNSAAPWTGTYPTLMGWNGSQTYGVRVDSARVADSATNALPLSGGTMAGGIASTSNVIIHGIANGGSRGYIYNDAGRFGFLNNGGGWACYLNVGSNDFIVEGISQSNAQMRSPIFYDLNDTAYYCDPNGNSRLSTMTVGTGAASYVTLTDDESFNGVKHIHANSNVIGFLGGTGGWLSYWDRFGNQQLTGTLSESSDERLKTDWAALPEDFIERLATVKHGTYTRIDTGARNAGVSANQIKEILPEAVGENQDGYLTLSYANTALVSSIQLASRVVELERRLAEIEAKLN
jgi:hypothetical protein